MKSVKIEMRVRKVKQKKRERLHNSILKSSQNVKWSHLVVIIVKMISKLHIVVTFKQINTKIIDSYYTVPYTDSTSTKKKPRT